MKKYFDVMKRCALFSEIAEGDMETMLNCLNARYLTVKKDENVFLAGGNADNIGIVLEGSVSVVQEDYWGNRTILAVIEEGGIFGEAFACACAKDFAIPVTVAARENGVILLVDCRRIFCSCSSSCVFHGTLIQNLVRILARKNIMLTKKIEHINKKSVREKILSYLSECALQAGGNTFEIPFDRQEMADYLSVDRSALSKALCKMRDDGIITFRKNKFVLL